MAVRIGVIGARFGAQVHIPAYQSEGMEVVAVCTRREESARKTAARFQIPHAFTDYREMLRMQDLDAVAVVAPRSLHYPLSRDAIEAGKHVICEKPLTVRVEEAEELWRLGEDRGLTCMIAHEYRFSPARAWVKELLDHGYVGKLHLCTVTLLNGSQAKPEVQPFAEEDDDIQQGGGFLWGQGSHYVDCLRHWFGDVKSVSGKTLTHIPERKDPVTGEPRAAKADDSFYATLEMANGCYVQMTFSAAAPFGKDGRIEIYGREGTLIMPQKPGNPNPPAYGRVLGGRTGDEELAELSIPDRLELADERNQQKLPPMRLLAREFVRGIETCTSPSPNFYDAYRVLEVLTAIRESSSTGRVIEIPPADSAGG